MLSERKMTRRKVSQAASNEHPEIESQINVPPSTARRLWKVIAAALRCPACGSTRVKAETGRRKTKDGMHEQYRRCENCHIRFRAVYE